MSDTDGDASKTPVHARRHSPLPVALENTHIPNKDSAESLVVRVSASFRNSTSTLYGDRINSDTRGTITVRGADGDTLTDNAVAVIIAPGLATDTQNRGLVGAVTCTLTALSVARRLCANNYLETWTGTATGVATNNAGSTTGRSCRRRPILHYRVSFITTPS